MIEKVFDNVNILFSGQPQNPLLLLGQYSDDEIDDESPDKLKKTAVGNPSSDDSSQVIDSFFHHTPDYLCTKEEIHNPNLLT